LSARQLIARKVDALERKYDAQLKSVFDAIRRLMEPPPAQRQQSIGGMIDAHSWP
jgi:hypothetical protein